MFINSLLFLLIVGVVVKRFHACADFRGRRHKRRLYTSEGTLPATILFTTVSFQLDAMANENGILKRIYSPNVAHVLNPASLQHLAREWLKEDTPSFDFAGFVVGEKEESAVILIKSPGVLAGCPFVDAVFKELDCKVEWLEKEGTWIEPIRTVATVSGKVRHLLLGERVALNCLCRASGIATYCKKLLKVAENCSWGGELAGTRKTTPGFRMVEKYALLVGGVSTHRYDLSSMIMLKDNHIWTAGSIAQVCMSW